jgi:hypothetical protein
LYSYYFTNCGQTCFGILGVVGLNLSEKKQKERKVAVVVTDSHDSRSLKKTATHQTQKRRPPTSHILFKADPAHFLL